MEELGPAKPWWSPPDDATPEQIAEFEEFAAKMLVPDESITTWVDVSGAPLEAKWAAIHEHVTQISDESPFMLLGCDGWRDGWAQRGLHPARVAGRVGAARDGPLRRDRLGAGVGLGPPAGPATTRAAAPSTP